MTYFDESPAGHCDNCPGVGVCVAVPWIFFRHSAYSPRTLLLSSAFSLCFASFSAFLSAAVGFLVAWVFEGPGSTDAIALCIALLAHDGRRTVDRHVCSDSQGPLLIGGL